MNGPYYEAEQVTVWHGDCIDVMRGLPDGSVDAVVTDPPYDLTAGKKGGTGEASVNLASPAGRARIGTGGFMGKAWDATGIAFEPATWAECWRLLKPGGHLLAFGGSRTWHRMAVAIEDAGFEIRESIAWLYGSGFPKSLDVSKAIDKQLGAQRKVLDTVKRRDIRNRPGRERGVGYVNGGAREVVEYLDHAITAPGSDDAARWEGWGTALKPAFEPIVVARKPLAGTVATNVLAHGVGALNIDGCRIPHANAADRSESEGKNRHGDYGTEQGTNTVYGDYSMLAPRQNYDASAGRWPANVALDASQAAQLDAQSGTTTSRIGKPRGAASGDGWGMTSTGAEYDDAGGASRFYFTAKADSSERPKVDGVAHPTVKPLDLMQWLVRLVTPRGGTVLEPFAGSGTTVEACLREGFRCIAIEQEAEYLPLIMHRVRKSHAVGFDFDWDDEVTA